jgi:carboxyl-terminal processing protease
VLSLLFGLGLVWTFSSTAQAESEYRLSSLRVFNRVVLLVKEQYVEPKRIKPKQMLLEALDFVEKRVPEVMVVEPKTGPDGEPLSQKFKVIVGDQERSFFLDDITSLWELSFKLRDVFRFMETRISPDVDRREIEYAAVNGMLSKLDPHSVLLEPRSSQEMKLTTRGEFGGLGIVISIRDGWLTVISPIDGTPASRAGIKAQDRIVKIEDESTINMGLDEAVERLRGQKGTEVTIWITRQGMDEPKKVSMIRDTIRVESVTHQALDGGFGYVQIKQFQGRTAEDVSAAVQKMQKEKGGELRGLILDLRNNPGGLLDQSVEVANLFLDDGTIVVTQEGGVRAERKEIGAVPRPNKIKVPVVVLVNGGSASASEIVSGALKNRGRGLIVGDQTFGKGSVQQLYDFPDSSSLKLTIGQYLTPGDESIQSVGITPDVLLRPLIADAKDAVNLFPDDLAREEDLAAHLDDARVKQRKPVLELAYLGETLDEGEAQRRKTSSAFNADFETEFAIRVLKRVDGNDRDALITSARTVVDDVHAEQNKRIWEALNKLGVDWTSGAKRGGGELALEVVESKKTNAGENLKVTLRAKNVGSDPVFQVKGISKSTLGYYGDREFLFGKIAPGEAREWTVEVKLPQELASRHDVMRVEVTDGGDRALGAVDVPVDVQGLERPRFSYALFIDDGAGGNGDGLLQVGETVDLVVNVKNNGQGPAERPMALLKNLGGSELFIEKGRQQLDKLEPGGSATARFSFKVQEEASEADLRLQVFDSVMGDYLFERSRFHIRAAASETKKRKGILKVSGDKVSVRAAAAKDSAVIATAEKGSKLAAVAEVGDYVRVKIGKELFGYVKADAVGPSSGKVKLDATGVPSGLSPVYGRDPPRIMFGDLDTGGPIVTDAAELDLSMRIVDDGPVEDVYVFAGDQKIFYKRLHEEGATDRTLTTRLTLEPGSNVVTVVAREDDEFAQREVLTIYSTAGDPFAEEKKISRH